MSDNPLSFIAPRTIDPVTVEGDKPIKLALATIARLNHALLSENSEMLESCFFPEQSYWKGSRGQWMCLLPVNDTASQVWCSATLNQLTRYHFELFSSFFCKSMRKYRSIGISKKAETKEVMVKMCSLKPRTLNFRRRGHFDHQWRSSTTRIALSS